MFHIPPVSKKIIIQSLDKIDIFGNNYRSNCNVRTPKLASNIEMYANKTSIYSSLCKEVNIGSDSDITYICGLKEDSTHILVQLRH